MEKLLEFIIKSISSKPEEVEIKIQEGERDQIEFHLQANPEDLKIIIGKKGRTIRAIRNLLKLKAFKEGKKISLIIDEKSP